MSETMERVWVRIPKDLKSALEGIAKRKKLRVQDVHRYALAEFVMNEAHARTLVDPGYETESGVDINTLINSTA